MATHSKFLELGLLETGSLPLDISSISSTSGRRHRPNSTQTTDPASTAISSHKNEAVHHNQGSDPLVDTTWNHLPDIHAGPSQASGLATAVSFGALSRQRSVRSSAYTIPRSITSPPLPSRHRSAHHIKEQRSNRLHYTITSPSSTRVDDMNLPAYMTISTSSSHQINYYSPTEAAAQSLYPSGASRPLIAQRYFNSAGNRASTNQQLHEKYPGDVPVPFGYRLHRCTRQMPDGYWTNDGIQDGGLDAGMGPRKCVVKRMIGKLRKIGNRWRWGGERSLAGTGKRVWILN